MPCSIAHATCEALLVDTGSFLVNVSLEVGLDVSSRFYDFLSQEYGASL